MKRLLKWQRARSADSARLAKCSANLIRPTNFKSTVQLPLTITKLTIQKNKNNNFWNSNRSGIDTNSLAVRGSPIYSLFWALSKHAVTRTHRKKSTRFGLPSCRQCAIACSRNFWLTKSQFVNQFRWHFAILPFHNHNDFSCTLPTLSSNLLASAVVAVAAVAAAAVVVVEY